jgi:hypothetical protein
MPSGWGSKRAESSSCRGRSGPAARLGRVALPGAAASGFTPVPQSRIVIRRRAPGPRRSAAADGPSRAPGGRSRRRSVPVTLAMASFTQSPTSAAAASSRPVGPAERLARLADRAKLAGALVTFNTSRSGWPGKRQSRGRVVDFFAHVSFSDPVSLKRHGRGASFSVALDSRPISCPRPVPPPRRRGCLRWHRARSATADGGASVGLVDVPRVSERLAREVLEPADRVEPHGRSSLSSASTSWRGRLGVARVGGLLDRGDLRRRVVARDDRRPPPAAEESEHPPAQHSIPPLASSPASEGHDVGGGGECPMRCA